MVWAVAVRQQEVRDGAVLSLDDFAFSPSVVARNEECPPARGLSAPAETETSRLHRDSLGGCGYAHGVPDLLTPKQLAAELGVTDRAVRQWLRLQGWQSMPYARWQLTPSQAALVRDHFAKQA